MPTKTLHFASPRHLSQLYADRQENLAHAERALGVRLVTREDWLKIDAPAAPLTLAEEFFGFLHAARGQGMTIRTPDFARLADAFGRGEGPQLRALLDEPLVIATSRRTIVPKTLAQKLYLQSMLRHPIVFGIGPAGTGKTYLAMAAAVSALLNNEVQRLVLTGLRSRLARPWDSCRATCARRSCPICAPSTTPSTRCWARRRRRA